MKIVVEQFSLSIKDENNIKVLLSFPIGCGGYAPFWALLLQILNDTQLAQLEKSEGKFKLSKKAEKILLQKIQDSKINTQQNG